jgi:CDP-6-deoxy-D-xylo-4-hexulose-3-dehydrase
MTQARGHPVREPAHLPAPTLYVVDGRPAGIRSTEKGAALSGFSPAEHSVTYPLATSSWDNREVEALQEVIDSGRFTMGKHVARFEAAFAESLSVPHCVMVNSGSSANLLMIAALFFRQERPLHRGDEVIVPAVSWPTTYYPLQQYGLRLRFVDIDAETLNYDLDALEAAVDERTRLIVAVNLLGNPNDFNRLMQIAAVYDIDVVEDNCESLGATFNGRQAGTFGLMGTFSSFFSHHIATMEGGVIATADEELHHILLSLRAHGWTRDLPKTNYVSGVKSDDDFEESFKFVLPGYNVRPLEMEGAVGVEQLRKLPRLIEGRRTNADTFLRLFADDDHVMVQHEIGRSSWFGFSMVLRPDSRLERRDVVQALRAAAIDCRPIVAGNFAKNPVLKWMDHEVVGALPSAELVDARGLFVGNQESDLGPQLRHLRDTMERLYRSR